jgi:hypothetical protein
MTIHTSARSHVAWLAAGLPILLLAAVAGGYLIGTRDPGGARAAHTESSRGRRVTPAHVPVTEGLTVQTADAQRSAMQPAASNEQTAPAASNEQTAPAELEPDDLSAEEARARHVAKIRASGPDNRSLLVDARRVGQDWADAAEAKELDVYFDDWECHRAGCLVNARHGSANAIDRATEEISHCRGFLNWNGEKLRTGPIQTVAGETEVTWILFAPREGEPAFQAELDANENDMSAAKSSPN